MISNRVHQRCAHSARRAFRLTGVDFVEGGDIASAGTNELATREA